MRHYGDFELEHLFNATGGFLLRWRIRRHLKRCGVCRERFARLQEDREFSRRLNEQLLRFSSAAIVPVRKRESEQDGK
jgi:hypothetical protein